ncbi:unnamed protein product [Symbiodinium sp. CCMP2456]|nr:unnamed protein product [Symbiodinium sp. CCMP2456]
MAQACTAEPMRLSLGSCLQSSGRDPKHTVGANHERQAPASCRCFSDKQLGSPMEVDQHPWPADHILPSMQKTVCIMGEVLEVYHGQTIVGRGQSLPALVHMQEHVDELWTWLRDSASRWQVWMMSCCLCGSKRP